MYYGNSTTVDLEAIIYKKYQAVLDQARKEYLIKQQSSGIDLKIAEASLKDLGSITSQVNMNTEQQENTAEEGEGEQPEAVAEPCIPEGSFVLQYGPKTIRKIMIDGIQKSFKLFWDGSVCMYQDNVLSSVNNKEVLNKLLDVRTQTNEDPDPPVTLLHGQETEKILRATLLRIKVEQQEALDAKKRAAEEA